MPNRENFDLLRQRALHHAYTFKYSRRPNTAAAVDFTASPKWSAEVSRARLAELQMVQEDISRAVNERWYGAEVEVLLESIEQWRAVGRGRILRTPP